MKILTILGEILPVAGTIGLLGLWFYQQKGIGKYTDELREINAARSVYQTYQSNNAIFNAIIATAGKDSSAIQNIRNLQINNYELGLTDMEKVLTKSEKVDLPARYPAYWGNPAKAIEITQKRLELLQGKLSEKESEIKAEASKSQQRYFMSYICFSIISILGAILKIFDKFDEKRKIKAIPT